MADLDSLDRTELIRLIRELQRQNEELRKQMEELRRKQHRSAAPFSKGKRKENPRRSGRKPGEGDFRRRSGPAAAPTTHRSMYRCHRSNVHFAVDDWTRSGSKMRR